MSSINHKLFIDHDVVKWKPIGISWVEIVVGEKQLQLKKQMQKDAAFINSIKCALHRDIYSGRVGYDDLDAYLGRMMIFHNQYHHIDEIDYEDEMDWANNLLNNGFYD